LVSRTGTNHLRHLRHPCRPVVGFGTKVACSSGVNDCTIIGPRYGFFVFGSQMQRSDLVEFFPWRMCSGALSCSRRPELAVGSEGFVEHI